MTAGIFVSRHAAQRYVERIDGRITVEEATAEIRSHARVVQIAAGFGCSVVRLANGAKLILNGSDVVTVIGRWEHSRDTLPRRAA